ncbi:PAS domain S-box protein [Polyangium sp. 6x1]|uniref:hybrid sensor histidine kinase/response regulator n=1 Tax=Polyangium sp. 6x1 TaxID=3042689 RepID=UPI0024825049|nr:PAS domain S-box protein [Polyangium sp. 6x1]MDI1449876.1 PAS domain S-box protein [Polyangium sp. 6x1]
MTERERADRRAWEGEMFRLLAENVVDYAVFVTDPRGVVLSWSKGAERLLGYPEDEVVGRSSDLFFTPSDIQSGTPQLERDQAQATGRGDDDRWHVRKDGTRFWSSGVTKPLRAEDGSLHGFAKILRDRTDLRRLQEADRERERQLELLTNHVPVLIAHCDKDLRYKYVNRPYAARFKLSPSEVEGRTIRDVLGDAAYATIEPHVEAVLRGERVEFEVELLYQCLGPQIMRCAYDPEFDEEGHVTGFVAAIVNVTESQRARRALRETEERLRTLSDNLPRGAIYQLLAEPTGQRRFLYVSAGVEALLGVTPAEILADASALYNLVHEDDRARMLEQEAAVVKGLIPFDMEYRLWTRWGSIVWIHCRSGVRRLPTGQIIWEGMFLDVTTRKEAEQALRDADRRKDEFLAMLAHELRNPLAPIRNAAQILQLVGNAEPRIERSTAIIERQVQHMARLVDDLLDVSRIRSGKIKLQKARVDVAAVVGRALETARPLLDARKHEVSVETPAEPVCVHADPTRLTQMVENLLTNAAKYTEERGRITVTVERTGDVVSIRVRDTGVGIPLEMLTRVFDLFTQVERSLARSEGGLGIGLTLVKNIAEMHGGTVEARSEGRGKGSEFIVRLPVLPDAEPPSEPAPSASSRPTGPRRILVVDDNVDVAESLSMLLGIAGHEVVTAHDGSAALEAARAFQPEVILLDIGLPGMNGYEVARRLRQDPALRETILVALTGYGHEEVRRQAKEAGFTAHLVKPVDLATLEGVLASAEASSQPQRAKS